ncbi:MAG: hypothetical protein J7K51_06645, partial [Thermotogae bacterium]|nr:hypothetical protein [Thermotogota bacterium]
SVAKTHKGFSNIIKTITKKYDFLISFRLLKLASGFAIIITNTRNRLTWNYSNIIGKVPMKKNDLASHD